VEGSTTDLWEGALGEDAGVALAYTSIWEICIGKNLHEQAGLSASTVTNNDQLATDFRHLRRLSMAFQYSSECSGSEEVQRVVVFQCMGYECGCRGGCWLVKGKAQMLRDFR